MRSINRLAAPTKSRYVFTWAIPSRGFPRTNEYSSYFYSLLKDTERGIIQTDIRGGLYQRLSYQGGRDGSQVSQLLREELVGRRPMVRKRAAPEILDAAQVLTRRPADSHR